MKKRSFLLVFFCTIIFFSISIFLVNCSHEQKKIIVGTIFPLSGDWGNYGEQMANGIKLWQENHKDAPIDIIYEDGKGTANNSISAYNKLIHIHKATALISGVSPVMLAIAPLTLKNNVFAINAGATNPDIKMASKNIFCIIPDANIEASYIADFLIDSLNRQSCFVYWKNDDSGKGMLESFSKQYESRHGVVVANEPISSLETIKNTLLRIKEIGVKTVFIPTNGEMIAKVIRQAYNMGITDILWVGYAAAESPELLEELQKLNNPNLIFSCYAFKSSSQLIQTKKFIEDYSKRYGKAPQYYSATCYDAISLISLAVENGCRTSEEIRDYIYALPQFEGVSGNLTINGHNFVSSGMNFSMFQDGRITTINCQKYSLK